MIALGQFLEVLIGGLMSGVLYSLVALGFVLIFKASGVFNYAQGAMVLLAGLALVRALDLLVAHGIPFWAAIVLAIGFAGVIMAPSPSRGAPGPGCSLSRRPAAASRAPSRTSPCLRE